MSAIKSIAYKIILPTFILFFLSLKSDAHMAFPLDVKCPICGKEFTMKVNASVSYHDSYLDFEKKGAIGRYYEYLINSCPKCHYSGYEDDFDTSFTKEQKKEISKMLKHYKSIKIDDIVECEIAAEIYSYLNRKNQDIAYIYLVASYLLRGDKVNIGKRKEMQKLSAKYFELALKNNEIENEEKSAVEYLIGELYRRTGEFEIAVKWYDLALKNPQKEDWIDEIATQQREMALKKDDNNDI